MASSGVGVVCAHPTGAVSTQRAIVTINLFMCSKIHEFLEKRNDKEMMRQRLFLLMIALAVLQACTSGGDDNGTDGLSTNACSDLGLGTKSSQRIVNGADCVNPGASPIVRLAFLNGSTELGFCSGSMITNDTVLSAAHCFLGNPTRVLVFSGDSLETSRRFEARNWSVHPGFGPVDNRVINDVAVVRLSAGTGLPTLPVRISSNIANGEEVSIFGYGTDENGNFDFQDLESGEMRVSEVSTTHIGAAFNGEGSNTCQGDSGGPVLSRSLGQVVIAGVTSTGTQVDCLAGDTTYFTNLADPSVASFLQDAVPLASYF